MNNKEKVIIFSPFNFSPKFLGTNFEFLQREIDKGNAVYYISNKKTFKNCGFNPYGLKYMCEICSHRQNKLSSLIKGDYTSLSFKDIITKEDEAYAKQALEKINTIENSLTIEEFEIGQAVYSSFISKTRRRKFDQSEDQAILRKLAYQSLIIYSALKRFIANNKIDKLMLFNGRWDYYRAAFAAARILKIKLTVFENHRAGGYVVEYGNSLPHNIKLRYEQMQTHWDLESNMEKKQEIASDFFRRKRHGEAVVDKSYTANQKSGKLPVYLDNQKKLIVLYNSSDDEFAAIGKEFANPLFTDQTEGILHVVDLVSKKEDYQLVIRVHPNLTGLEREFLTPIYELRQKYPNVFVVMPDEDIDTYALMEEAYKVVTFGSTIGLESSYWGKPVVLLGKAYYYYSDVAYVPQDRKEILSLLFDELNSKPRINAEKHAYYYLTGGSKATYFSSNKKKEYYFNNVRYDDFSPYFKFYYKAIKALNIKN